MAANDTGTRGPAGGGGRATASTPGPAPTAIPGPRPRLRSGPGGARPGRRATAEQHAWRPDIQGLRAVAVLLVVLSHAGVGGLAGGYVGVDVFFVISGFLITSLLARELAATGSISLRRFYARRALRLLPAASLVAVATLGGAWLYLSPLRLKEYTGDALASVLYAINLRLADAETDYLSEGTPPSPFQHFWSLAVEEQFYLVWPLLLLLSAWPAARRAAASGGRGVLAGPFGAVSVLCVASFALGVSTTADSAASWAYFGSHTRAWELGAGSLLALAAGGRLTRLPAAASAAMTWAGLAAIALAALRYDEDTPFPGHHALLPVLGAALVLAGGCAARPAALGAQRLLGSRPLTWLGGLSYGWYLWHWPLLLIGPSALDRPVTVPLSLALSALALPLAWLTLHLVENPVRFHRSFRGRPGRALGVGAGLTAGATAMVLAVVACAPWSVATGGPAPGLRAALTSAPDPTGRLAELLAKAGTRLPSNLSPPLAEIKQGRSAVYRDGCHAGYEPTRVPAAPCVYGDPSSETVVALYGDSHAAHWFPALRRLAREEGWKLVALSKASCKVPAVTTVRKGEPYEACDAWREDALAAIAGHDPDLVIVSSTDVAGLAYPEADTARQWEEGYRETYRRLGAGGARLAIILDNPWPKEDAVECAASFPTRLDRCAHRLPDAFREAERRELTRDAARRAGVAVIDPAPWLCSAAGACPVVVADTVVYRDHNHLNEAYAEAVAPVLGEALSGLVR